MEISTLNIQEIEVTAVYFRGKGQEFESFPRRMVMDGREYNFLESGMQYLISKGQQLVKLFDVSDGQNEYRLRQDGNGWTLVNTKVAY